MVTKSQKIDRMYNRMNYQRAYPFYQTGGMLSSASGIASGISGLADKNKYNDGTAGGQAIGSALDIAASAMGIPTFGMLGTLGSGVGSLLNGKPNNKLYRPSGNTSGNWSQFQQGGYFGTYPMSTTEPNKRSNYEFYMNPEDDAHMESLNKKYDLPSYFLQSVAMGESGRGYKKDGKLIFTPNNKAESQAGAQGPFQFRKITGKEYGLDSKEDRQNIKKAAEAAAKMYSKNRNRFGSLNEAMIAYNWGSTNARKHFRKNTANPGSSKLPRETSNYINKLTDYREQLAGYPNSLESYDLPTVTAPRSTNKEIASGKHYNVNQRNKVTTIPYVKGYDPNMWRMQEGGNTNKASVEIEGGEYVYNRNKLNDATFRMLDNTGKQHKSDYGYIANGKNHSDGGIKVMSGDAYIASKYLGIDGKKSSKTNMSVAELMLKNGGRALALGSSKPANRRAINHWNPGAMRHHLNMMDNVVKVAERNKLITSLGGEPNVKSKKKTTTKSKKTNSDISVMGSLQGFRKSNKLNKDIVKLFKQRQEEYTPYFKN
jgi:hypothetical protein